MNQQKKPIPSRQSFHSLLLVATFGVLFTGGGLFILIYKLGDGEFEADDTYFLPLCFAFGFFFLYATFCGIRNNIRLKNGYYQDNTPVTYHYKGDEDL